jgi:DNA-binding transcriptional MerR regulator
VTPKLYKAGDVCEATGVQPYVLRSWEKEFPGIGVQKSPETPRLYRQSDVDQVLRIKQLVFGEGLTLAGARRRIEETFPQAAAEARDAEIAEVLDTLGADARQRIALVRGGLKSILDVLARDPGAIELAPLRTAPPARGNGSGTSSGGPSASAKASARLSSGSPERAAASKRRVAAPKASKSKRRTERF